MIAHLLLVAGLSAPTGLPDHPRVYLDAGDFEFLRDHLDHPLYRESWQLVQELADNAAGPRLQQYYRLRDIDELWGGGLYNPDSREIMNLGLAYQMTGQRAYADRAAEILRHDLSHMDVSYQKLDFWYTINWDLMGVRTAIGVDCIWDALSAADRAQFSSWLETLTDSVRQLHERATNTGYYSRNGAGGNIKAWDNALIGLVGFLLGDRERIEYAIAGPDNLSDGIQLHYVSQIRNGIVEEWSGPNSQYGPFRTVDWHRSIDKDEDFIESVSYQGFHQYANELLCRAALRHGRDLYRLATRADGGDLRHHPFQPIERLVPFVTAEVEAEHNQFRTWNGSKWIYSDADRLQAHISLIKMAGFADQLASPALEPARERLDQLIRGGLKRSSEFYAEFHVSLYAWPLTRIRRVRGVVPAGDLSGRLLLESEPAQPAEIAALTDAVPGRPDLEIPLEVDLGGEFDAFHLPAGSYSMIARCAGFQSTLFAARVEEGSSVDAGSVALPEGEHAISPPSMDYVSAGEVPRVRFAHRDPDGLDAMGPVAVFLQIGSGPSRQLLNLTQIIPNWFEVEESDSNNLVFSLSLAGLSFPDDTATFWFVATDTTTGALRLDRARYRFE